MSCLSGCSLDLPGGRVALAAIRPEGYDFRMTLYLNQEQSEALAENPDEPLELVDPITGDKYLLVKLEVYVELARRHNALRSETDPPWVIPDIAQ
jgi:hypothetical protein